MGLFVMEGVRGQLPRLWGPLGVDGTALSAEGVTQAISLPTAQSLLPSWP